MRLLLLFTLIACLSFSACGKKEALKEGGADQAPTGIAAMALNERNLARIVNGHSQAVVNPTPWASYWFPYGSGGISAAARKYDTVYKSFLQARGVDTTNYQAAADWERTRHSPAAPLFEGWFGHCNGWSASSLMYPEPREPKTIDGIEFSVGDQKALIAESWMEFSGDFVGKRVNDKGDFSSAAFWDVAPAQFTLLLANVVSGGNRGLILDRYTGDQIWNQPLVAYKFEPIKPEDNLGAHPSAPDVYRVNMRAQLWWADDNVPRDVVTDKFEMSNVNYRHFKTRHLQYELWLDAPPEFDASGNLVNSGNILVTREDDRYVGGAWKNAAIISDLNHSHPDYMWVPFAIAGSSGYKNERVDDNWIRENIAGLH